MNTIIKQVLAFILSFALIFSSTSALAASPNGWAASPADIVMNGATATINAVKGSGSSALQSTIKHAPAAGRVAKHLLKVGGVGAVAMAVTQILGDGVDWVLDPANNAVRYKLPDDTRYTWRSRGVYGFPSAEAACMDTLLDTVRPSNIHKYTFAGIVPLNETLFRCRIKNQAGDISDNGSVTRIGPPSDPKYDYISISDVASKVQANAQAGDVSSQELLKTVAIDDVESGALDVPLNIAAVPKADAPAVPDPNAPPIDPDAPPVPFDPSSIISAIKSVMAAVVNMSGVLGAKIDALMIDLGLKQAETIEAITAGTGDIVAANDRTGAKVAEMVAAIEAIEGNTLDGQVINDAVDRVIANDNVKVGDIVAAIEAIEGNTLDGQVINDAIDRVIANDNANAQAATDAASAAADAAKAADAANTAAVTDAIEAAEAARAADAQEAKEAADAKAAADAEFQDWVKEEAPVLDNDTELDIPMPDLPMPDTDINFGGSCPANFEFNGSMFGNPINIVLLDTSKFCGFLSTFVKFPVYAASSLFALYILGGRKDV